MSSENWRNDLEAIGELLGATSLGNWRNDVAAIRVAVENGGGGGGGTPSASNVQTVDTHGITGIVGRATDAQVMFDEIGNRLQNQNVYASDVKATDVEGFFGEPGGETDAESLLGELSMRVVQVPKADVIEVQDTQGLVVAPEEYTTVQLLINAIAAATKPSLEYETRTFTLNNDVNPGSADRWESSNTVNGKPVLFYTIVRQPQKAIVTFDDQGFPGQISTSVYVPEGEEYGLDSGEEIVVKFAYQP